ncbi:hypothetical protein QFZ56_007852 [Streptomyces achromogenes]|uniref:Uncharacterized protein n=1 Tax=Streptomyces achromogenes TaxID=67255 RepID=A0ABU0QE11_STRAH|nr:hypothetical protein [Streptomyces achromogenes]
MGQRKGQLTALRVVGVDRECAAPGVDGPLDAVEVLRHLLRSVGVGDRGRQAVEVADQRLEVLALPQVGEARAAALAIASRCRTAASRRSARSTSTRCRVSSLTAAPGGGPYGAAGERGVHDRRLGRGVLRCVGQVRDVIGQAFGGQSREPPALGARVERGDDEVAPQYVSEVDRLTVQPGQAQPMARIPGERDGVDVALGCGRLLGDLLVRRRRVGGLRGRWVVMVGSSEASRAVSSPGAASLDGVGSGSGGAAAVPGSGVC